MSKKGHRKITAEERDKIAQWQMAQERHSYGGGTDVAPSRRDKNLTHRLRRNDHCAACHVQKYAGGSSLLHHARQRKREPPFTHSLSEDGK
jgi:hypothetical protein